MNQESLESVLNLIQGKESVSGIDYYALYGFAVLNKIAGYLYLKVKDKDFPKQVLAKLQKEYEYQVSRNTLMADWMKKVGEKLEEIGIPYAFLKGNVLSNADFMSSESRQFASAVYLEGERVSNDIDILVSPKNVGKVESALRNMGFKQGYYNTETHQLRELSRREILERRMNRGETVPYHIFSDDFSLPHIEMDINFSLDYLPSGSGETVDKMLQGTALYALRKGGNVRSLDISDFFIHLLLHQYKEMRVFSMVMRGKDLELYKLLDIFLMSKKINQKTLSAKIKEYGVEEAAACVLKTVKKVFSETQVSNELQNLIDCISEKTEYVIDPTDGNTLYAWKDDVFKRLSSLIHFNGLEKVEEK